MERRRFCGIFVTQTADTENTLRVANDCSFMIVALKMYAARLMRILARGKPIFWRYRFWRPSGQCFIMRFLIKVLDLPRPLTRQHKCRRFLRCKAIEYILAVSNFCKKSLNQIHPHRMTWKIIQKGAGVYDVSLFLEKRCNRRDGVLAIRNAKEGYGLTKVEVRGAILDKI
jgi:hypothetical protein